MIRRRNMESVALGLGLAAAAAGCGNDEGAGGASGETAASTSPAAGPSSASAPSATGSGGNVTSGVTASSADASSASTGAMLVCSGKTGVAGDTTFTLSVGGEDRTYHLHAPPDYDPTAPTMVVFMFHGYFENGGSAESRSGFSPMADERGFIAVYPEGRSSSWNAGACCGSSAAQGVDDVGLVGAILDEIEANFCVDTTRVYAAGFSNGGMLSHRLGCELSDRFAAVAPVAGTLAIDACAPTSPVAVMHTHGTSDPIVPYGGGGLSQTRSVDDTIADWVENDACTADVVTVVDMAPTVCTEHATCDGGDSGPAAAVRLCRIEGGVHDWPPGGGFALSEAILDFFEAHPKP